VNPVSKNSQVTLFSDCRLHEMHKDCQTPPSAQVFNKLLIINGMSGMNPGGRPHSRGACGGAFRAAPVLFNQSQEGEVLARPRTHALVFYVVIPNPAAVFADGGEGSAFAGFWGFASSMNRALSIEAADESARFAHSAPGFSPNPRPFGIPAGLPATACRRPGY
jgi:hypothetical protein